MSSYCLYASGKAYHSLYHDKEYGFPAGKESEIFERLALEINQAGLSWLIVLKKREALNEAFDGFNIDRVAEYERLDRERLLSNNYIIRNRRKIDSIIYNAKVIRDMRSTSNGIHNWLQKHHPLQESDWVKLFKKTFKFTGGKITCEFLTSLGYLPGAHHPRCPVFAEVAKLRPPWMLIDGSSFN